MKRLIIFLVRKKLGLKKYQEFQFVNQKTNARYFFTSDSVMKMHDSRLDKSSVSLNWLLDDECQIIKMYQRGVDMDEDFKEYVERLCKWYGWDEEEAKQQAIVKEVQKYYEELLR